eukprot:TRINITY_DN10361_c0_g1_i1.p1 TRINITY_DN10361_c0_g1~~TRINITY_DN10361_c0_g1_i1.p1  ORF type:complete len:453 (+),score=49.84 TRINITY_DN10361_c0_g1_i1:69-1427(+)
MKAAHTSQGWLLDSSVNIRRCWLATLFLELMQAISLGALFDNFLFLVGGSNAIVGSIESGRGIAVLLAALAAGWLGDRWVKTSVLRGNALAGCCAVVFLAIGILCDSLSVLLVAVILAGGLVQIHRVVLPVLLAEMTSEGEQRRHVLAKNFTAISLGQASGPLIQYALIQTIGSTQWSPSHLHVAICAGLFCYMPYVVSAWNLHAAFVTTSPCPTNGEIVGLPQVDDREEKEGGEKPEETERTCDIKSSPIQPTGHWWHIPLLMELSGLLTALGNGMTFKFWTLFYRSDLGFTPKSVCLLTAAMWVAVACGVQLAPRIVDRLGGGTSAVLLHFSGTALMYFISTCHGRWSTVMLVLLRYLLMKANGPMLQAMVLDMVPMQHRGKWTAVESLKQVGWSGTAALGGWISDTYGYRQVFLATACVHVVSGALLVIVAVMLRRANLDNEVNQADQA